MYIRPTLKHWAIYWDLGFPLNNNYGQQRGVGVDTLGSESILTCLPLRLASQGPSEVLSYLLDKFWERLSKGAVTGPPHKQTKKQTNKLS